MMDITAREAELMKLTAKALRPIAADLGVTGASRMAKADIVNAIVGAEAMIDSNKAEDEGTAARFNPEVIDELHAEALEINTKWVQIAADLGVTGASRMKKADIVAAIVKREADQAPLTDEGPRDLRLKY